VVGAVDLAGGFEQVLLQHRSAPINTGVPTLSFDARANGWLVGEGAGAVVLKRPEQAEQAGDRIYGVIEAIACVHDPSDAANPSSPSSHSVATACQQAFAMADVRPASVGYLEVFGSGIAAEDDAEIKGLLAAYQTAAPEALSCCIGSIKANVGHTFAASGMASLIKTALCLYHRYLPATPQWSEPKSVEQWQGSPFYVAESSRFWFVEPTQPKRVAAINGLGADGAYAHLILSEGVSQQERPTQYLEQMPFYLFPLAVADCEEGRSQLTHLQETLQHCDTLYPVAHQTLQAFQQQSPRPYTLAIVGSTVPDLQQEIEFAVKGIETAFKTGKDWQTPRGSYFTANPQAHQGSIAVVYPGMGSSSLGLGRDLFRLFPHLHDRFSTLTAQVSEVLHAKSLYPRQLSQPQDPSRHLTRFLQNGVALCQSGISLAMLHTILLREIFAVQPQSAFGYSMGEASSMMFALGLWQDGQGQINRILNASQLFSTELYGTCEVVRQAWGCNADLSTADVWQSYLLAASSSDVREILKTEQHVYLTFINTPQEVVIAGDPQACLRVIAKLNCSSFQSSTHSILHSELVRTRYQELVHLHNHPIHTVPEIQLYSGVTGEPMAVESDRIAQNSAELCCQTVDFPKVVN
jgi:PfaB family protein